MSSSQSEAVNGEREVTVQVQPRPLVGPTVVPRGENWAYNVGHHAHGAWSAP